MIQNKIYDSRDIQDSIPGLSDEWLDDDYSIYIPQLQKVLTAFLNKNDKPIIVGGQENECLKEVTLLLQMNDIEYIKEYDFIF